MCRNRQTQSRFRILKRSNSVNDEPEEVENVTQNEFTGESNLKSKNSYELTIPITLRGNYKSSIEYLQPYDNDEIIFNEQTQKIKFPELIELKNQTIQDLEFKCAKSIDFGSYEDIRLEGLFDLEKDAKEKIIKSRIYNENEKKLYRNLITFKTKTFSKEEKHLSINRYKSKKENRKMTYQIRYKVRQDLAVKRLRNKGKFIISK